MSEPAPEPLVSQKKLDRAHKAAAQACGLLATMLARRIQTARDIDNARGYLTDALHHLERRR